MGTRFEDGNSGGRAVTHVGIKTVETGSSTGSVGKQIAG
jgi:hypothetical protein